jgi:hypothetical protein
MAHARVVEVDYYQLVENLKKASNANGLIEKADKEKWKAYITEHNVQDIKLEAFGKVKFVAGKPRLAAISTGGDWDGCYTYSHEDEAALKWEAGE